ncbi:MAG: toll/interleukin-1 receptor domain-containing protein [Devosia sp.]
MPDIFISYKKEERDFAASVAARLTQAGYDVWWDDALLAGERFEDEISTVLDASRLVVILWSHKSVDSEWVKAEAEAARQQKKALPVIIDDMPHVRMPLLFRGLHVARLTGWKGEENHSGFVELMSSIGDRLGKAAGPKLSEPQAEMRLAAQAQAARQIAETIPAKPITRSKLILWASAAAVLLIAAALAAYFTRSTETISPADRDAIARCAAWSRSARLDWASGLPRLELGTHFDCGVAADAAPNDGDTLGRLAMVRTLEGSNYAAEAIALANRGVEKRSGIANFVLGAMYENGINLGIDVARASTYYRVAADLGFIRATGKLCLLGLDAPGKPPLAASEGEIANWCREANEAGDALGQIGAAYIVETGFNGLSIDNGLAVTLYQRAIDQGSDEAAVRLGILYSRGAGVAVDLSKATALFQLAADNGLPAGIRSLAVSYELGNGITQDINHAAQLYEQASVRRDIPALLFAGYGIAPGIPVSARTVRDLEMLASDPYLVTAHRMRGQLLARGFTRGQDVWAAERDFRACADVGNSMCEVSLGYFYFYGQTGTRDFEQAIPLFKSAADKGNLFGQYWLGYAYENGLGVDKDPAKGISYYRLAAAQGHLTAANHLQQLGVS